MPYTAYAIKKIYENFAWLFLWWDSVSQNKSKREKIKIKTLTFEHKNEE